MRGTLILSNLTYPPSQGLHEQAVAMIRFLASSCDKLQLFVYCKNLETLDQSALAREMPGSVSIRVIPYSGSDLRRGFSNRIFGKTRVAERELAKEIAEFDPGFVHLDMAVAAGLHWVLRRIPGVISWMDPGSRRQFRLTLATNGITRSKHIVAGFVYYVFEVLCRSRNKTWHVVSPSDRHYFLRAHPGQRVVQIPVAITTDPAVPGVSHCGESNERTQHHSLTALIFLDLRVPHLLASFEWLVEQCLLPLEFTGISIHYKLLGRVPPNAELSRLSNGLHMEFLQWVDDLSETLSTVDFVILPDQVGTGLKTRAVHVLAAGCAVIGTPYALEGIELTSGTNAIVAESPADWRDGLRRLATDADLRERLKLSSPESARPFEATAVFGRWEHLYAGICGQLDSIDANRMAGGAERGLPGRGHPRGDRPVGGLRLRGDQPAAAQRRAGRRPLPSGQARQRRADRGAPAGHLRCSRRRIRFHCTRAQRASTRFTTEHLPG